jgi:hypothetical protein
MGQQREAVKKLAPEHREAIEATGYGPGLYRPLG